MTNKLIRMYKKIVNCISGKKNETTESKLEQKIEVLNTSNQKEFDNEKIEPITVYEHLKEFDEKKIKTLNDLELYSKLYSRSLNIKLNDEKLPNLYELMEDLKKKFSLDFKDESLYESLLTDEYLKNKLQEYDKDKWKNNDAAAS